jgi:predicted nucleic acid-binding protein
VAEVWIVNASPLISLARIGHVHLLAVLAADVVVPEGVITEVSQGPRALGAGDLGAHRVVRVGEIHPTVAAWDLGLGEGEVLSLTAATPGARAILDDGAARQCAAALGVPVRGTLGVVLEAKRAGAVQAVAPLIDGLRSAGLFLSESLVQRALASVGEQAPTQA